MNTWTFRVLIGAIAAVAIKGCVPVPDSTRSGPFSALPDVKPVYKADLMRGLSVVAPEGYCVDPDSLKRDFALMARCDTLGIRGQQKDVPLAIITATSPRMTLDRSLPDPGELVDGSEALLDSHRDAGLQLVKIAGTAPAEGLSGRYWRGAAKVGTGVLGLAIYPPANSPDLDRDAIVLLNETFQRSKAATSPVSEVTTDVAAEEETTQTIEPEPKKTLRERIAGLLK